MKKAKNKLLLIVFMLGLHLLVNAQTSFPDDTLDNPVPFDGGVAFIIAAVVGYGLKKANDRRKADKL